MLHAKFRGNRTIGDREPIIVNISHESKSVGNFEAAMDVSDWLIMLK